MICLRLRRPRRALVVVAFTLVSCSSQALPASTPTSEAIVLRLYATPATMPVLTSLTQRYQQIRPEITFDLQMDSYANIHDRLDTEAYFLTYHLPAESATWAAPVGQDALVIIVDPANPVTDLTIAEVRDLFRGHIRNWRRAGGEAVPVTVFSREEGAATRAEFQRLVLGTRRTTSAARVAPSGAAMRTAVTETPGSIGYLAFSQLDSAMGTVSLNGIAPTRENIADNRYPLRLTLYIAGRAEPVDHMRAFIGWVQSPAGQAIIARCCVPLQP